MKKTNIKTLLMAALVAVMGALSVSGRASAVGRALSISPLSQQVVLSPGESYSGGFTVSNPAGSESELSYIVTTSPFSRRALPDGVDDYGDVDLTMKTTSNSIMDWTTIENPFGTVSPNGQQTIYYTIDVPYDAPAGGQYMALLVRENTDNDEIEEGSANVKEVMQMAFVVYAEITGETRQEGEILENNVPSFLFSNTLEATSMVRNNGNVHTFAKYTLQVWPMGSDEEICTNEEDASSEFVMPDSRKFHTEVCDLPLVGAFNVKQTVTIFGESSVVEKMVIVCPLWLLFIVVVVVISAIVWLFSLSKKRKGSRR